MKLNYNYYYRSCFLSVPIVGLERTTYIVEENAGSVEVCVVFYSPSSSCPAASPFSVFVVSQAGSAGALYYFTSWCVGSFASLNSI